MVILSLGGGVVETRGLRNNGRGHLQDKLAESGCSDGAWRQAEITDLLEQRLVVDG